MRSRIFVEAHVCKAKLVKPSLQGQACKDKLENSSFKHSLAYAALPLTMHHAYRLDGGNGSRKGGANRSKTREIFEL